MASLCLFGRMSMARTMEDYIREIPQAARENIKNRKELTARFAGWYKKGKLVIVASGSSYNAAVMAEPFLKQKMDMDVSVITPFSYVCDERIPSRREQYLFVSQSGCSTNVLEAVRKHRENGFETAAAVGNADSAIAREADVVMDYGAGEETVGYVTKGMSLLCLFFMLCGLEVKAYHMSEEKYKHYVRVLKGMAKNHEAVLRWAEKFYTVHEKSFLSMRHVYFMGSGSNWGAVLEGALKVGEMVHVQTSAYEAEEFIHGPDLQLTPEYTLFFLDSGDKAGARIRDIWQASKEITDHTFLVSAGEFPETMAELTGFYLAAFFQYAAYRISKELGIKAEHPLFVRFDSKIPCKTQDYEETAPF